LIHCMGELASNRSFFKAHRHEKIIRVTRRNADEPHRISKMVLFKH